MNGWRSCIYPVPDDGFETLERIMISLPDVAYIEVSWERLPAFVVTVDDPKAAIYLRLSIENGPPTDSDGNSLLEPEEVWVVEDERAYCERLLVENCPSRAVWRACARMMFASDEAHRTFGAAYTLMTGLPHAPV